MAKLIYDLILDCTNPGDLVIEWIEYKIDPYPLKHAVIIALNPDMRVQNTVTLLNEIYHGKTLNKQLEANNIRRKLIEEIRLFQSLLFNYFEDGMNEAEKQDIRNQIRRKLSFDSAFTAFKIWIIKRNSVLMNEFGALLPS